MHFSRRCSSIIQRKTGERDVCALAHTTPSFLADKIITLCALVVAYIHNDCRREREGRSERKKKEKKIFGIDGKPHLFVYCFYDDRTE